MEETLELKKGGFPSFFLGVAIRRIINGILISQSSYVDDILETSQLTNVRIVSTLMDVGVYPSANNSPNPVNPKVLQPFARFIVAVIRPNLEYMHIRRTMRTQTRHPDGRGKVYGKRILQFTTFASPFFGLYKDLVNKTEDNHTSFITSQSWRIVSSSHSDDLRRSQDQLPSKSIEILAKDAENCQNCRDIQDPQATTILSEPGNTQALHLRLFDADILNNFNQIFWNFLSKVVGFDGVPSVGMDLKATQEWARRTISTIIASEILSAIKYKMMILYLATASYAILSNARIFYSYIVANDPLQIHLPWALYSSVSTSNQSVPRNTRGTEHVSGMIKSNSKVLFLQDVATTTFG
ncbi:uncharacterized protein FTOL_01574 [Fusarium torulosum]|uniref:Reverse transcriptase Ty1/copia-type domain-containing protein n=1 Tax=Fusarium torulosum TaxID=33205 RepID=A0AAE8M097_9HYPO|nr:uncharacterized protein FTOL_01574 [Fusarium torulosum]